MQSHSTPHQNSASGQIWLQPRNPRRLWAALVLVALAIAPGELGRVTRSMMVDAYMAVSVFVAATLLIFYTAERRFGVSLPSLMGQARWAQVPIAAALGALPGCGGAVVVVAAYGTGHVGFGAVVATLTATMGDAAFLLIATRPDAALVLLPLSFAVGIASGWAVDRLRVAPPAAASIHPDHMTPRLGALRRRDIAYLGLAIPGLALGVADLANIAPPTWLPHSLVQAICLAGVFLGLAIWASSHLSAMSNRHDSPLTRVAEETSFITVWVIGAFLAYEYAAAFLGLELGVLFQNIAPLVPLIAVLVGFIPGCGPQVLVTTLYLNGVVPFAALVGNAISNDGDALFPAIALNPRAALLATLYSGIPAVLASYGFYLFFPDFLN